MNEVKGRPRVSKGKKELSLVSIAIGEFQTQVRSRDRKELRWLKVDSLDRNQVSFDRNNLGPQGVDWHSIYSLNILY